MIFAVQMRRWPVTFTCKRLCHFSTFYRIIDFEFNQSPQSMLLQVAMASLDRCVDEVLQCSICLETFKDPRMLPCQHTFCKACLESSTNGKRSGDTANCALCRRGFVMPVNGIDGIDKSLTIIALLDGRQRLQESKKLFEITPGNSRSNTHQV